VREQQTAPGSEFTGGLRDPHNFWDFYDVWTRPDTVSPFVRDKAIAIADILSVARRFGSNDGGGSALINRNSDPLVPPAADTGYHPDFDRGVVNGPYPWDRSPPDGAIGVPDDILAVAGQFGHSCL
jgi:hypothetical protein